MTKVKVKASCLGSSVYVNGLGRIKLREDHADLLFRMGMTDFLDGITPPKKLVTAKPKAKRKPRTKKEDAATNNG